MTQLIEYFKNNQRLLTVTAVVLIISAIAVFAIILARKYIKRNRAHKKELMEATEVLSNLPYTDAESELFLDPVLNEETQKENEEAIKLANMAMEESETENAKPESAETDFAADENIEQEKTDEEKSEEVTKKSAYKPVNSQTENETKVNKSNVNAEKSEQVKATISDETSDAKEKFQPKRNTPQTTKYAGKWLIYTENGKYAANLVASNGEILLRTESYTALSGIKSGIETVKNNIAKNNFAISVDKNGNYFFKLYSSSTRLLCFSEGYSSKSVCESAIESVKRFSKTAVLEIKKEDNQYSE